MNQYRYWFYLVSFIGAICFFTGSCHVKPNDHSKAFVTNPIPAKNSFQSVVELISVSSQGKKYLCSGTFIAENLLITSAHCVYDDNGRPHASINYKASNQKIYKGIPFPSEKYNPLDNSLENRQYDFAIIGFDENCAPEIAPLSSEIPTAKSGEIYTLVGWGETNSITGTGARVRNYGRNEVFDLEANSSLIIGYAKDHIDNIPAGQSSVISSGDSGGAMFNSKGELVGVIRGGNIIEELEEQEKLAFGVVINVAHPTTDDELSKLIEAFCHHK